jgi:hypothetical protein
MIITSRYYDNEDVIVMPSWYNNDKIISYKIVILIIMIIYP